MRTQKKMGTMDKILIIVAGLLFVFTVTMIIIFCRFGFIPDTLCTCVYSVLGSECGAMAWIKTTKERNQIRKWELEDRKTAQKENEINAEQSIYPSTE